MIRFPDVCTALLKYKRAQASSITLLYLLSFSSFSLMASTGSTGEPRTLVLCFDGTADSYDDTNTNIIRLFSLLEKDDPEKQLVYYQPGLGTYVSESVVLSPTLRKIALVLDQAVAWYLDAHIMGGYKFLMENYRPGDKICLFGFSRGAYTARCLAGMLHKVGLLPKSNTEQIPFAYERYADMSENGNHRSEGFKKTFSKEVEIDFIGVWDTVSSVGIFYTRHLPFTSSNTIVKTFRHALALDERRVKFNANMWHRPAPDVKSAKNDPEAGTAIKSEDDEGGVSEVVGNILRAVSDEVTGWTKGNGDTANENETEGEPRRQDTSGSMKIKRPVRLTDIKEVWFAGCHADVGGGSVSNAITNSLAGPSLRWMLNEIIDHSSINLKPQLLCDMGIDPNAPSEIRRDHYLSTPAGSRFTKDPSKAPSTSDSPGTGWQKLPSEAGGTIKKKDSRITRIQKIETSVGTITNNPQSPLGDSPLAAKTMKGTSYMASPTSATRTAAGPSGTHFTEPTDSSIRTAKEEHGFNDAISPKYDQLKEKFAWWILELLPLRRSYQDEYGRWHKAFSPHFGRGRHIHQRSPLFHSSVRTRQEASDYVPKAKFAGEPIYVD
ncbi:hypothetical protein FRC02_009651 [Tulasnella sp. 418]|nr:hypothetical protein FRC02_009651 [Tulasnella sp. 418]